MNFCLFCTRFMNGKEKKKMLIQIFFNSVAKIIVVT